MSSVEILWMALSGVAGGFVAYACVLYARDFLLREELHEIYKRLEKLDGKKPPNRG